MERDRYLIVNADDFGQSAGINRGIIEAYEHGVVTSASLMVRWPGVNDAAAYARAHPDLSVGLHLDFGEWFFRNGEWQQLYHVVDQSDEAAILNEIRAQLAAFRSLLRRDPTHIDSHQHQHLQEPARAMAARVASDLGCPLRSCNSEIEYVGGFYGQTAEGITLPDVISVEALIKIIAELTGPISELGCHPGYAVELDTMYRAEREREVKVLCDPVVRESIENLGIQLVSFAQIPVAR